MLILFYIIYLCNNLPLQSVCHNNLLDLSHFESVELVIGSDAGCFEWCSLLAVLNCIDSEGIGSDAGCFEWCRLLAVLNCIDSEGIGSGRGC